MQFTGTSQLGILHVLLPPLLVVSLVSPSSATSVLWAVTGAGECNATCGVSVSRSLEFACYAADSPSVVALPQTSPRMFAAKSPDGKLPSDRCAGIPLPKTRSVECLSVPSDCEDVSPGSTPVVQPSTGGGGGGGDGRPEWRWNLTEIRCSARCNHAGVISVPVDCVNSSGAPTKTHFCEQRSTRPDLAVPCYQFDGCVPEWKAGPWGLCSRDCGLGEIDRKVDCYQLVDSQSGPYYQERRGQCSHSEDKPHLKEYCVVRKTCQPYYRSSPGKCRLHYSSVATSTELRLCNETGLIRNNPQCVQLTADLRARSNITTPVSSDLCRDLGLTRPEPFSKCQVDDETLRQQRIKCLNPKLAREPQFDLVSNVLVQMERRESLPVSCGQSATVIPGTQVRLYCKVANFKPDKLKWRRQGSSEFIASGASCKRVCIVDGELVIQKFRPKDSGVYEVFADSKSATLSLHSHSAYEAYVKAYLPRMMLLQPNSKVRQQTKFVQLDNPTKDTLLWMTGPWAACSIPCGGTGHRTRSVYCEQLQSSLYAIVNDSVCQSQLGERPGDVEACGSHTCPVWQAGDWDSICSERHCYSPGYSLLTRKVQCVNQVNQPLADAQCAHETKPETVHKCRNQICQPKWQTGEWSSCSVSCGAYGFSSRQIQCVWEPTGRPAGIACETAKLELPKSFKACYNGACERLGCADLSPVCSIYQASALCAHPSLRRNCCKTCNEYQVHVYNSLATRHVSKTTA